MPSSWNRMGSTPTPPPLHPDLICQVFRRAESWLVRTSVSLSTQWGTSPQFSMLPLTGVQINEFTIQSEPSWLSLVLLVMAGGTAEAKGTCCPPAPIQADPALKACAALSLSDAAAAQEETHAPT